MNEVLQSLQQMINPEVIIPVAGQQRCLTLKENAPESKLAALVIKNLPANVVACSLDNPKVGSQLSPYLNKANGVGINKSCDLVLFWMHEQALKVLLLELKSDKPDLKEARKQLTSSELFIKYLLSLSEHFYPPAVHNVEFIQTIVTYELT